MPAASGNRVRARLAKLPNISGTEATMMSGGVWAYWIFNKVWKASYAAASVQTRGPTFSMSKYTIPGYRARTLNRKVVSKATTAGR